MTLPRVKVSIAVALACSLGTLVHEPPGPPWPLLIGWALHADLRHLIPDLGAFLAIALLVEGRAGSGRTALWCVSAVAFSNLVHRALYPEQIALFGLSAVTWTVAGAGAATSVRSPGALAASAVLMLALLASGHSRPLWELWAHLAGATTDRLSLGELPLHPVPWVHDACAVLGLGLGGLARHAHARRPRVPGRFNAARRAAQPSAT